MSQVRKFQEGGTAPTTEQKYAVKVNGQTLNLGHEQLQSWFNDYVKAGGGKTKNRDEWNSNFNNLLGTIKESNTSGKTFDFDLQGDTIGAIDYTGDKGSLTNDQLGLKDNGKSAKAGLFAGVTGVKDQSAIRASLLSGLADYSGKSYTETMVKTAKELKDKELKDKTEADKLKAQGLSDYNTRLSSFDNDLNPTSRFKGLDGKSSSMEYAVTQYNKLDEKGRKQFLANYGNDLAGKLNQLHTDSQGNEEYSKAFTTKFGKDVMNRLKGYGTNQFDSSKFLHQSNPETISLFTNPETYNKLNQQTAPKPVFTQGQDGSFSNGDGRLYLDDKGTPFTGQKPTGERYINGNLADGEIDGLRYNQGKPFEGLENDTKWVGGQRYSGPDSEQGMNYDYTNYKSIPLRLEGKSVDFDTFINKTANDPKYKNLSETAKKILELGKVNDLDKWTEGNSKLERNSYDPYEGLSGIVPQRYKNLSGAFSNFDPSKGAILQEFRGKYDTNGNPITNLVIRRGKFRSNAKITMDRLGRYTLEAHNGDKVFLGSSLGDKPKDISSTRYNFNTEKSGPSGVQPGRMGGSMKPVGTSWSMFNKEGGKLEQLKKLQYGGLITGQEGKKEKYHEVGLGEAISDPNYQMTTTDKFQLGALVGDIGSLAATVIPGVGNATAAGVGAVGSLANFGANVSKDGFQASDAGELAIGLGLDALTLLPGLGTGAKSAKILRALKGSSKVIGLALAGAGAYQAQESFRKIIDGKATMDDWRHLATGLTGALSGKRMAFDNALATSKGAVTATIKDAKGEKYILDNATTSLLEEAKSQKDKANIAKNYIANQLNKGGMGPSVPASAVELEKGFGLKGWRPTMQADKVNVNAVSGERTLDPLTEDANVFTSPMAWMKNRAIKRVAMGNPMMAGAEEVLGNGNKLASTPWGRKFAWLPSGNVKSTAKTPMTTTGASTTEAVAEASPRTFTLGDDNVGSRFGLRVNAPETVKPTATTEQALLPTTETTSAINPQDEIIRKGNKLMNIYIPRSQKPVRTVPAEISAPNFSKQDSENYRIITDFIEAAKPKKQEVVKNILDNKISDIIPVKGKMSDVEVKSLRRNLGLATNKEHDISLNDIFSAPKGSAKESLAKKILKNKKLSSAIESAIDEGKTSIKLQTGGKLANRFDKSLLNWKPKTPFIYDYPTQSEELTNQYTTNIANTLGLPNNTPVIDSPFYHPKTPNLTDTGLTGVVPTASQIVQKPSFISNFVKGIDTNTVSELGRALFNRNLSKNVDTRMSVPLMQNVDEIYTPVKGDLTLKTAYNRSANNVIANAGRPRTSDSMLDLAGRLSSNKQAEDFRLQGDAANAEAIAKSEQQHNAMQAQYAQGRQQVANQNAQAFAQKEQVERQMGNQKMLSMGKSLDNFWASQNQKAALQGQQNKMYDSEIAGLGVSSKYSNAIAQVRGDADTAWNAYNKAQETGDPTTIANAKKVYDDAIQKGTRVNNNLRYIQMQLQKDPKWDYANQDVYGDLLQPKTDLGQRTGLKFFNSRPTFASGGKLSVEDKFALEEYKANTKTLANETKEYNKWMMMRAKDDKQQQISLNKSLSNMISTALKGK